MANNAKFALKNIINITSKVHYTASTDAAINA